MNNKEFIEALEARITEIVDTIMPLREELSKARRMLAIAKERPAPPDEPEEPDNEEEEYKPRHNGTGPGSTPGRPRTNRKEGPLTKQQSYDLALDIFRSHHPRSLDRRQLARKMGYKEANGTTTERVHELLANNEIKFDGKNAGGREQFKYVDDEV